MGCIDSCLATCAELSLPQEVKDRRRGVRLSPEVEEMITQSMEYELAELSSTSSLDLMKGFIRKYELPIPTRVGRKSRPTAEVYADLVAAVQARRRI